MKMVGEEDIIRKMEREERRQFQFLHMDENGGRGRKQLENGVRGKTTISIFTRGEKWRERKRRLFEYSRGALSTF